MWILTANYLFGSPVDVEQFIRKTTVQSEFTISHGNTLVLKNLSSISETFQTDIIMWKKKI